MFIRVVITYNMAKLRHCHPVIQSRNRGKNVPRSTDSRGDRETGGRTGTESRRVFGMDMRLAGADAAAAAAAGAWWSIQIVNSSIDSRPSLQCHNGAAALYTVLYEQVASHRAASLGTITRRFVRPLWCPPGRVVCRTREGWRTWA